MKKIQKIIFLSQRILLKSCFIQKVVFYIFSRIFFFLIQTFDCGVYNTGQIRSIKTAGAFLPLFVRSNSGLFGFSGALHKTPVYYDRKGYKKGEERGVKNKRWCSTSVNITFPTNLVGLERQRQITHRWRFYVAIETSVCLIN